MPFRLMLIIQSQFSSLVSAVVSGSRCETPALLKAQSRLPQVFHGFFNQRLDVGCPRDIRFDENGLPAVFFNYLCGFLPTFHILIGD